MLVNSTMLKDIRRLGMCPYVRQSVKGENNICSGTLWCVVVLDVESNGWEEGKSFGSGGGP